MSKKKIEKLNKIKRNQSIAIKICIINNEIIKALNKEKRNQINEVTLNLLNKPLKILSKNIWKYKKVYENFVSKILIFINSYIW